MDNGGVSAGEVGGMFAGIVVLLGTLGKGVLWLFSRQDTRETTRTQKLDLWHAELCAREAKMDAETEVRFRGIEAELAAVKADYSNLGAGFLIVANGLHKVAPGSPEMTLAQKLLGDKFPLHLRTPEDLEELVRKADQAIGGGM